MKKNIFGIDEKKELKNAFWKSGRAMNAYVQSFSKSTSSRVWVDEDGKYYVCIGGVFYETEWLRNEEGCTIIFNWL